MNKSVKCNGWMVLVSAVLWSFGYAQAEESLPEGIDGGWWSTVQSDIRQSEYDINWQEQYAEYQSPNRAQDLRFSYYNDGFKVRPRVLCFSVNRTF